MRHALEAESRHELEHYERLLQAQALHHKSQRSQELTQEQGPQQPQLLHRFATLREAEEFEAQQKLKQKTEQLQGVPMRKHGCGITLNVE